MAAAAPAASAMKYRVVGNTGLVASALSFGFWATFGVKESLLADEGVEQAVALMRQARKGGVNCFDNAEAYGTPNGEAERIFGLALERLTKEDPVLWRRSELIITTKIFWGGDGLNEKGLSRKHIQEGTAKCLARLRLDYVDLLFCHRPDKHTPTETVVRAMTEIVRSGKAQAWGTSEWSAQQITEAYWIATMGGLEPPQVEQPQYNLFTRDRMEKEYGPLFRAPYKIGTTIWSPLSSGLLSGKYNSGEIPADSRPTQPGYDWLLQRFENWKKEGRLDKIKSLSVLAETELGCSVAQLAIAWCVKNPNVSTVLMGATNAEQLGENLAALSVVPKLDDAMMAKIEAIMCNKPDAWDAGFRAFDTI